MTKEANEKSDILTKQDVEELSETIRNLYLADDIPWVIGYSGGKDSTATLQLIWLALRDMDRKNLKKAVHVIHTDTMLESPIVEQWARGSLRRMKDSAKDQELPFEIHRLTPDADQTFWVNLLGRGYPFPRKQFRWCTDRLKIKPVNNFVQDRISQYGEIIMVLGTRKAESAIRARRMAYYEKQRVRELLSPNPTLMNELVFSPLENWTNDDVWLFLMQYPNPWGLSNNELLTLYKGATADNECPMMVSKDLPSCGNSRFGCWMCTMVTEDKSMSAMIANDQEKRWLTPLLKFRNEIGNESKDFSRRSFRKMNGSLQGDDNRLYHGPYKKEVREKWLHDLLVLQDEIQKTAPAEFSDIELITMPELRAIRRIWVKDKHEFEDSLPRIFEKVTGRVFEDPSWINPTGLGQEEWELLKEACEKTEPEEELILELVSSLLSIEAVSNSLNSRGQIYSQLEKEIQKHSFKNEEDATDVYLAKRKRNKGLESLSEPEKDEYEDDSDIGGTN